MEECRGDKNWDHFLQNKVVQKLKLSINVQTKIFVPICLNENYFQKKTEFNQSGHLCIPPFQKKIPLNLITFKQNHPNFLYPILILSNRSQANKQRQF